MKGFTSANNDLMQGKSFAETGDIRNYLKDGAFVGFGGVDKNAVTDSLSNMLIANAINELYRTQASPRSTSLCCRLMLLRKSSSWAAAAVVMEMALVAALKRLYIAVMVKLGTFTIGDFDQQ